MMTYQYLAYTPNVYQKSQATYSFSETIQNFPAELDKTSVTQSTAPEIGSVLNQTLHTEYH